MNDEILKRLAEPFPPEKIRWRVGSTNGLRGMALAYIDARDLFDRLDQVVTPCAWQSKVELGSDGRAVAGIGIAAAAIEFLDDPPDHWIWKWDGAGATAVEPDKGSISDALKRAGVQWGIARYLYDFDNPWVPLEERGRSKVFTKEALEYLKSLVIGEPIERPELPEAPPTNWEAMGAKGAPKTSAPPREYKKQPGEPGTVTLKRVWAAGFQAAEKAGAEKYAALNYAQEQLGVKRLKDIDGNEGQMRAALSYIADWEQGQSPNAPGNALPEEPDDSGEIPF